MQPETSKPPEVPSTEATPPQSIEPSDGIVTTEEEWEGYYFVKAILHDVVDPSRITIRDARSYCAILLDNNNRKPICRFYFDSAQKYVSVFDNEERKENKIPITDLNELFKMADHFKKVVAMYDKK